MSSTGETRGPWWYRDPIMLAFHPARSVSRVGQDDDLANVELRVLPRGLDGRSLSTETAGGFTGRVIGMFAIAGRAHVDWFDYTGGEPQEGSP